MPVMGAVANGGAKNYGQTSRVGYAWGGHPNLVYRSGSNFVHICNASQVFIPTRALSNVEYLVIGGGGAGGEGLGGGGGGGAGGYRSSVVGETSGGGAAAEARLNFSAFQHVTVTIGAGGGGNYARMITVADAVAPAGAAGGSTTFGTITAAGGGGGGQVPGGQSWRECPGNNIAPAASGGSGGGGGGNYKYSSNGFTACASTGAAGTAGQGYAGGAGSLVIDPNNLNAATFTGQLNTRTRGGGGGGAGGAGGAAGAFGTYSATTKITSGNGGAGLASSITGTSVTRAGGGAGGARDDTDAKYGVGTTTGGGGRWPIRYWVNANPPTLSMARNASITSVEWWIGPYGIYYSYGSMHTWTSEPSWNDPTGAWTQANKEFFFPWRNSPAAGTPNTGSGGTGASNESLNGYEFYSGAGSGGSGVVIVRYAA